MDWRPAWEREANRAWSCEASRGSSVALCLGGEQGLFIVNPDRNLRTALGLAALAAALFLATVLGWLT